MPKERKMYKMGIVVDLILVLVLLVFIFMGYKRGLTGSLLKLVSFAAAIVLALILYNPVANLVIENTNIDEKMAQSIIDIFSKNEENEEEEDNKGVQNTIINNISKEIENATEETRDSIVEQSARNSSIMVIKIGSAIVIFLVAKIALVVVSFFIKGITELPIIKQVDAIGGIAYGFIEGMLIIYIVLAIISFVGVLWEGNTAVDAIEKSVIGSMLYNNNIVVKIFFK